MAGKSLSCPHPAALERIRSTLTRSTTMQRFLLALGLVVSPLALAQTDISRINEGIGTEVGATYGTLKTVNGAIRLETGVTAGEVSTVNGSIQIADNVTLTSGKTVNGSLSVGENSAVETSLTSVNGRITLAAGTRVGESVEARNGSISAAHATIGGGVKSVNGDINLQGTTLGADLETTNGNIVIGRDSLVRGDVVVRKPSGFSAAKTRMPTVKIEAGATVEGRLVFEREVKLEIDPAANVKQP